jgi:hypothetical protein
VVPAFAPGGLAIVAATIGVGARYPSKPLMGREKQQGAKGVAKNNA